MTDASLVDLVLNDVVAALRLGRSVLLQAAMQGHADVLRYLLQRVSGSNSTGSTGSVRPSAPPDQPQPEPELVTALSEAFLGAAEQGHSHCLSALLESSASLLDISLILAADQQGETALMVAARAGCGDCFKTLLQHSPGAQVAAVSKTGNTALTIAARYGHAGCVRQLLRHHPQTQVAAADACGCTALIFAAEEGHAEVVGLLLQHTPGTQVAAADNEGNTALIMAAWEGHAECVELLLQHDPEAQVAATDHDVGTALMSAVFKNHPECATLLLAHSPATQVAGLNGNVSVVELAAYLGHPQCLDLLLAHDPPPQHLDAAWLAALQRWNATHERTSPHTQCLERLHAKGALLPLGAALGAGHRAKSRRFFQDWGSRALVADRVDEAIVGLALNARGRKRKAGQGGEAE